MSIKEFIERFSGLLSPLEWYDSREVRTMASYLLKEVASVESYKIIVSPEMELEPETVARLLSVAEEMATGCPMQYALGYEYFCGHKFKVKEGVLIPRPETEELVRLVVDDVSGEKNGVAIPLKILDICTGSGCIAWSLASALPQSRVWGCDVSDKALGVAESQIIGGMESCAGAAGCRIQRCSFFRCDILGDNASDVISNVCGAGADCAGNCGFDVIVSNPPYVCVQEKEMMRPNVLDFEPELALFVPDDDPLLFYKKIAELSGKILKEGGRLYFEVNERFAKETASVMEACGFEEVAVVKDMFGKERMVKGVK